jgi:hypothetical protein
MELRARVRHSFGMPPILAEGEQGDFVPDCDQVVVGLVVNREGFPSVSEVFDGNTRDSNRFRTGVSAGRGNKRRSSF